jgi:hypothetical protein
MVEARKTIRPGVSWLFWGGLPLVVLAFALYYIFASKPTSGWVRLPLHPRGVATILFANPEKGLASLASQEPYNLLGFSKVWKDAAKLSSNLDALLPPLGILRSRAGQWIYQSDGSAGYVEMVEFEDDSLSPKVWQGSQLKEVYLLRDLQGGAQIAEPREPSQAPYVLFWKNIVAFCEKPVSLEELVERPLSLEIERKVPTGVLYGLALHIDQWGLAEAEVSFTP